MDQRIVVLDVETSGTNPNEHAILEVGILVLDRELNEIDAYASTVVSGTSVGHLRWLEQRASAGDKDCEFVHQMHQKSGLAADILTAAANGRERDLATVEAEAIGFMRHHSLDWKGGKTAVPMTGSSVHFDRGFVQAQMPALNDCFHYRNIDVSTLKGLVDIYRADIAEERKTALVPSASHRVLDDCRDTVKELAFYLTRTMRR